VKRAIREFVPDIISALFLPDYGWLAGLCGHHPLAVSAWGSDILISPLKSRWHKRRIEYVLRQADILFADAELLGVRMRELGADESKIHVIPLGVDAAWLNARATRVPLAEKPFRIISNRHLEPLYRVDTFVRAAALLAGEDSNRYMFVIVGSGSRRPELTRLVVELGLGSCVEFLGTISEEQMRDQLRQAELFISCSSSDGTSVSMLEAMASGCVPIMSDLAVNHEWIKPGENGLLFPVGDAGALANAIRRAAEDAQWRDEVRERNRVIIQRRALWEDNMAAVEQIMLCAVGPRRRQPASPGGET
jgi:glycosyltransferase involved in cell wall biosynthesis